MALRSCDILFPMARGKTFATNVVVNNMKTNIVSKTVELSVVNDQLVPEKNDLESGVNSRY